LPAAAAAATPGFGGGSEPAAAAATTEPWDPLVSSCGADEGQVLARRTSDLLSLRGSGLLVADFSFSGQLTGLLLFIVSTCLLGRAVHQKFGRISDLRSLQGINCLQSRGIGVLSGGGRWLILEGC